MGNDFSQNEDWKNDIDWSEYGLEDEFGGSNNNSKIVVKDANGNTLAEGDTVIAIKDLKVKGSNDIKRGDKFKNIRLTDDEGVIESGKMVLKTEFFKKL